MTTELLGVLQEIVKNYMNAIKMTDKATGTVIKTSPLTIQTDTSLPPISGNALILTSNVIERTGAGEGRRRRNRNGYGRVKSGRQGPSAPRAKRAAVYCIIKDHIRRSSWQYYRKVWGLM